MTTKNLELAERRRHAMTMYVTTMRNQSQVAKCFFVSRQAVNMWVKVLRKGGMEALEAKPLGRPRKTEG